MDAFYEGNERVRIFEAYWLDKNILAMIMLRTLSIKQEISTRVRQERTNFCFVVIGFFSSMNPPRWVPPYCT